jgi:hypothetical protein
MKAAKRIVMALGMIAVLNSSTWWASAQQGAASATGNNPNADATTGPDVPLPGYSWGKLRADYFKYKDEKPLFSIDANNVDKYADKLSAGQVALIKQRQGYRMDVYPAHRTCTLPDWVRANSELNRTQASLNATNEYLEQAVLPGVPFPEPKNGAQVMTNFQLAYRGVGYEMLGFTDVSPRPGDKDGIVATWDYSMYFPWGTRDKNSPKTAGGLYNGQFYKYESPPAFQGQALVERYYFKETPETWYYFAGQRRVRRLPVYTYDAPILGFEGQYLADQVNLFMGPLDRFDWKIVGTKDLYIPYNDFAMYDFQKERSQILQERWVNPANRRYELHRVLVIEATVKKNARHVAPKKLFYVDPDSWMLAVSEDYDTGGKLWTTSEAYPIPVWELGSACDAETYTKYDLISGRYTTDVTVIGNKKDIQYFTDPGKDVRFTSNFYSADVLKSVSER